MKKAYAFLMPCGHAALLVADEPDVLKDSAGEIKWALSEGYQMKHIEVAQLHDGTIQLCPGRCEAEQES